MVTRTQPRPLKMTPPYDVCPCSYRIIYTYCYWLFNPTIVNNLTRSSLIGSLSLWVGFLRYDDRWLVVTYFTEKETIASYMFYHSINTSPLQRVYFFLCDESLIQPNQTLLTWQLLTSFWDKSWYNYNLLLDTEHTKFWPHPIWKKMWTKDSSANHNKYDTIPNFFLSRWSPYELLLWVFPPFLVTVIIPTIYTY